MSTNLQCITTLSNELVLFLREFVKKYPAAAAGFLWTFTFNNCYLMISSIEGDMSKNNNLGIPCWNWIFYNLFLPWEQNFHLTWFWTLLFIGCIPPVPATPILSTPKKERSQMEIGKKCGDPQKSEFSSTKLS